MKNETSKQRKKKANTVAAAYYGHGYCGQLVIVDKKQGTVFSRNKICRLI